MTESTKRITFRRAAIATPIFPAPRIPILIAIFWLDFVPRLGSSFLEILGLCWSVRSQRRKLESSWVRCLNDHADRLLIESFESAFMLEVFQVASGSTIFDEAVCLFLRDPPRR